MRIPGIKPWLIIMAVLVLLLAYLSVTSDGNVSGGFSVASVIMGGFLVLVAYRWGGWKRS